MNERCFNIMCREIKYDAGVRIPDQLIRKRV